MSVGVQRLRELAAADVDLIAVDRETVLALLAVLEAARWFYTVSGHDCPDELLASDALRAALARLEET